MTRTPFVPAESPDLRWRRGRFVRARYGAGYGLGFLIAAGGGPVLLAAGAGLIVGLVTGTAH